MVVHGLKFSDKPDLSVENNELYFLIFAFCKYVWKTDLGSCHDGVVYFQHFTHLCEVFIRFFRLGRSIPYLHTKNWLVQSNLCLPH